MKSILALVLAAILSPIVLAQAPVEERRIQQTPQATTQQKADYFRKEKNAAADRLHQTELELKEAERHETAALKHYSEAQQRTAAARKAHAQSQAEYSQAEIRAAQAEAEARQTWQGGKPAK